MSLQLFQRENIGFSSNAVILQERFHSSSNKDHWNLWSLLFGLIVKAGSEVKSSGRLVSVDIPWQFSVTLLEGRRLLRWSGNCKMFKIFLEKESISIPLITDPLKIFKKDLDLGRRKKATSAEIDLIRFPSATCNSSLLGFYEIPPEIDLPRIQIDSTNQTYFPPSTQSTTVFFTQEIFQQFSLLQRIVIINCKS